MNVTTKMLKDLLEQVESGEAVITNFDVSNEAKELEPENGWANFELTGEQTFYITTKPGVKKPTLNAVELFGKSVSRFGKTADWLSRNGNESRPDAAVSELPDFLGQLSNKVNALLNDYENDRMQRVSFAQSSARLETQILDRIKDYSTGSSEYLCLNRLLGRLQRALSPQTEDKDNG